MSAMPDLRRCSSAFLAMKRVSRVYGSREIGSITSQIRNRVLCERTGSMVAESGSGMSSMSLSSIDWNPRMLEPSNPRPSLKLSTSSSPNGRLKCCHVPGRSTKRTSTTSTPSAFARSSTSRGLVLLTDFVSTAMNTLHDFQRFDGPHVQPRNGDAPGSGAVDLKWTGGFLCGSYQKLGGAGYVASCGRNDADAADSLHPHVFERAPHFLVS